MLSGEFLQRLQLPDCSVLLHNSNELAAVAVEEVMMMLVATAEAAGDVALVVLMTVAATATAVESC